MIVKIASDVYVDREYERTIYGPYHRVEGGADGRANTDGTRDLVTTACGLDLPRFDSIIQRSFLTLGRSDTDVCGDCFPQGLSIVSEWMA